MVFWAQQLRCTIRLHHPPLISGVPRHVRHGPQPRTTRHADLDVIRQQKRLSQSSSRETSTNFRSAPKVYWLTPSGPGFSFTLRPTIQKSIATQRQTERGRHAPVIVKRVKRAITGGLNMEIYDETHRNENVKAQLISNVALAPNDKTDDTDTASVHGNHVFGPDQRMQGAKIDRYRQR